MDKSGTELFSYLYDELPGLPCIILTSYTDSSVSENTVVKNCIVDRSVMDNTGTEFEEFCDILKQSTEVFKTNKNKYISKYTELYKKKEEDNIRQELGDRDSGFTVVCDVMDGENVINGEMIDRNSQFEHMECFDMASTARAFACLCKLPNGVITMSPELEGLVQTSLNLGVITLEQDELRLSYAVRSSVDEDKERLCRQMIEITEQFGAKAEIKNPYPGWAYRKESPLRDIVTAVYEKMYGREPVLEAIHAGVECGILAAKIPGLDCVSIGPNMSNVHTAEESLDIASVQRMWEYLLNVLACK